MEPKGLVLINTGDGKGKTTAALGTAFRAWGDGQRVLILQFIKGAWKYGELEAVKALGERIRIMPMGDGFVFHNKDRSDAALFEEKKKKAEQAWTVVEEEVSGGKWDLIVLDEINYAVHFGLVDVSQVVRLVKERPDSLNLILTGRCAAPELIELADTVTEMKMVKHAFQKGIRARKGIEF